MCRRCLPRIRSGKAATTRTAPTAVATRHKLIDRVIADNIRICGSHFPFPGTGTFVKDGNAYGFTPTPGLNANAQQKRERS